MHNMLADAMIDAMYGSRFEHGDSTIITVNMLIMPDVKKFRPGMPMDDLQITCTCMSNDQINVRIVRTSNTKDAVVTQKGVDTTWSLARQFLRGLFSNVKLFDFKHRDPFFIVTKDEGRNEPV